MIWRSHHQLSKGSRVQCHTGSGDVGRHVSPFGTTAETSCLEHFGQDTNYLTSIQRWWGHDGSLSISFIRPDELIRCPKIPSWPEPTLRKGMGGKDRKVYRRRGSGHTAR